MAKRNKWNSASNNSTDKMAQSIDDLAEFEDFQESILPKLRAAIKRGDSVEQIYAMAKSAAAGKIATMAIKSKDPKEALALCSEILNRSDGKAKERIDVTTKYEKMTDQELAALVAQQKAEDDELQQLDS